MHAFCVHAFFVKLRKMKFFGMFHAFKSSMEMVKIPDVYISRKAEIVLQLKHVLESPMDDFMAGRVNKINDLKEIADIVCLHPIHLKKVVKLQTDYHACHLYEQIVLLNEKK